MAEVLQPKVKARIAREIKELATKPPEGVRYLEMESDNLAEIHAELEGPGACRLILARGPCSCFVPLTSHP